MIFSTAAVCAGLLALVCFPDRAADAVREALGVCAQTVVPALFPYMAASSLFLSCGCATPLARALAPFMRRLFGVSGAGAGALVMGLLGGYPVGARTVGELYRRCEVEREEAEQLLCFCNNSGPGFFLGVCGGVVLHNMRAGLTLYLIHVCAALLTGIVLRRDLAVHACRQSFAAPTGLLQAVPLAVSAAWNACAGVCGCIMLFRVLILPLPAALYGVLEMTGGVLALGADRKSFVICAAITGWGGLSVLAQTAGLLAETDLSLRRAVWGKALHAAISAVLAGVIVR